MPDKINRYSDLEQMGYGCRVSIWRKVREGKFPSPQNIFGRPGWTDSRIKQWLESQPDMNETA